MAVLASPARRQAIAVAVAVALGIPPVTPASAQDDDAIEEIVVTGSRLTRRDFTSPSPIATIDRGTLLNSGQPTLEATLNQMPQITPTSIARRTTRATARHGSIFAAWVPIARSCC